MKAILLTLASFFTLHATAQVPKAIVVEHFTNSRCSICASRNPGLYTNLDANPEVMHIAYHPSSPYSNCIFSQHNPSENDLRTNFYGVYGATPRIVINGDVTNKSFTSSDLFDPYKNAMSEFDVRLTHRLTVDSVHIRLVVKVVAQGSSQFQLTVGVAEDTVYYNAPNGEGTHYDVFREFAVHDQMYAAATVGDSTVYEWSLARRNAWNGNALYAYALLQDSSTDDLLQAGRSAKVANSIGMGEMRAEDFRIYPNPASTVVKFEKFVHFSLFDMTGREVREGFADGMEVRQLPSGVYILRLNVEGESIVRRLIVE
ncbi:T9SS type A sorting domain-containing protein [Phaeocystidibacter marisrubri]|uniref:T9SS type A sorting domain-containing protein n=1 Tax=Phaeocystidibacter marisrubri TaxID=1577780 RepID=A0A6L3ZGA5_9FLAO|nr:T9SS type A sorting domain-containing protein [Phaeocystidibacter marisrubri]KAB2816884.1 T9SS type A sorting domain-containing protein [Phaeocystidibacter marisrubri]GGH77741.1 hypothetical protein GCM10011318_27970 [Phaeocystidibacter marisrubri]